MEAVLPKLPLGAPRMVSSLGTPEEVLEAVGQVRAFPFSRCRTLRQLPDARARAAGWPTGIGRRGAGGEFVPMQECPC